MSKTIKLEDQVYNRLEQVRDKRETFSQVVDRLLTIKDKLREALNVIEGQAYYARLKAQQLEPSRATPPEEKDVRP